MSTRALIYTRKSADTGDRGSLSLGAQEARCRERATLEGLTEVVVYSEGQGVSASKSLAHSDPSSRPALTTLLGEVRPGDVVVAWEVSRLGRDEVDAGLTLRSIMESGGSILTLDGTDTRRGDQLGFGLRALLYAEESRRLADRVRAGKRRQKEAGKYMGGVAPFGFRKDEEGHLQIIPEEADLILEMARRALDGGSWRAISKWLDTTGMYPRGGLSWTHATVCRILQGEHSVAILGRETSLRLKAIRTRRTGGRRTRLGSLTGVLRCGRCGRGMNYDRTAPGTGGSYRCPGATRNLCPGVSISATPTEVTLVLRMVRILTHGEGPLLGDISHRLGVLLNPTSTALQEALVGELVEVDEKVADLAEGFARGELDRSLLAALTAPLVVRRKEIEEAMKEIGPPMADPSGLLTWAEEMEGLEVMDLWLGLESAVRREILLVVWPSGVAVDPGIRGRKFSPTRLHMG